MPDYKYWVHGVNVQIEFPDRIRGGGGNARADPLRAGWGTKVFQEGTRPGAPTEDFNWFHFALPTPTEISDTDDIMIQSVFFAANIGPNAHVVEIHVREGSGNIIHGEKPAGLTSKTLTYTCKNFRRHKIKRPIVLSLKVVFVAGPPRGWIIFEGAGASFKKPRPGRAY